jgi:hypothetical protein
VSLRLVLEALQLEETAVIDSAPVPCVGYKRSKGASAFLGTADYGICSSKAMKYFGCKIHSVVSLRGIILGFLLTPANCYDNQPVVELLDSLSHHLTHLLGDGAYNDAVLQNYLEHSRSLRLLAPVKVNQAPTRSGPAQIQLNRLRLICETVNAQLQEQLHLSKHYAKSTCPRDAQRDGKRVKDGPIGHGEGPTFAHRSRRKKRNEKGQSVVLLLQGVYSY